MYKKILCIAGCSLALAACTGQKTASTDEAMAKQGGAAREQVSVSESPRATDSSNLSTFVFNLDRVATSSTPKASAAKSGDSSEANRLGKATFREVDGKVVVSISMENKASTSSAEPAHIHVGACPAPGEVKYPLTSVVNGKSETTLPDGVTIASLRATGPLAVNIHKSAAEPTKYIACGNLDFNRGQDNENNDEKRKSEAPSQSPKETRVPRPSTSVKPLRSPELQ